MGFDSSENLALIKADLQAAIKSQFNKSKRLFDLVSKQTNSDTLEGAGAAIVDTVKSRQNAVSIERVMLCFDLHKNGDTELSKLINEGAIAIREGTKKSKVVKDLERTLIDFPQIILGNAYALKQEASDALCKPNSPVDSKKGILNCLCHDEPKHLDLICYDTGIFPGEVSSLLLMLELEGAVRQLPGMNYLLA